jgi:hypothetical protein
MLGAIEDSEHLEELVTHSGGVLGSSPGEWCKTTTAPIVLIG